MAASYWKNAYFLLILIGPWLLINMHAKVDGYYLSKATSRGRNSRCCDCSSYNETGYTNSACSRYRSFLAILQTIMAKQCDLADPCRRAGTDALPPQDRFDFIIVGAGIAGPIVAKRLSDSGSWKVLLVEAGPEEPALTSLPGLSFNAINSSLDWKYWTEPTRPHPTACLENGGACLWPRGKMVSGTAGMYGMMYARGHPSIYDQWSRMGNRGWDYAGLKRYFETAENPVNPEFLRQGMFDEINTGGPMVIDYFRYRPKLADEVLEAAAELGYRTYGLRDYTQTGFMIAPMLTHNGLRGTTSRYYLRPSSSRANLHVLTNAYATRLVFESGASLLSGEKLADGIEIVDKEGNVRRFKASKDYILTAGAIGSPQILMQSGIGPTVDLASLGIPVITDLPVGRNLQNHVSVAIKMTIKEGEGEEGERYESLSLDSVNEYVLNRSGPLSSTGLTQLTAFLESDFAEPGVPDIQVFFDDFSTSCADSAPVLECPADSRFEAGGGVCCSKRREIVVRPTVIRTSSRGHLQLRSRNPFDYPLIYPDYFTNATDLEILVQGIKKVIELTGTNAMRKRDLKLSRKPHPWCARFEFGSDEYWRCFARVQTGPENHQSGTCRMAPKDNGGVVDDNLRVHGIWNVRVADASVFPILTNANPVSAIVAVAEKAAADILAYHRYFNLTDIFL